MLFFTSFVYAVSFEYFDVKLDKPYQIWNIFTVQPKNIDWKIVNMHFFINNEEFPRISTNENNSYQFKIPSKLQPWDKNLKVELDFADKTKKEYVYKLPIPYFIGIDATNLTWWWTFEVYGTLTWSCILHLWDLSLSISSKNWKHFFTMPDTVKNLITNSYVVCNGISSNTKSIKIFSSPELYYAVSENKKVLSPWDTLIVAWNYIRLKPNDDIKVLLNGKKINYKFLTNNKFKITLPHENLSNASIQVIRNWFKSNTIKLNVIKYPKIYQVGINNKGSKYFFRLYWDFDFKLWWLSVNYAWKTLKIISTWSKASLQYIDVALPKFSIDEDKNINCDYYLYPSYFYVTLWTKKSNWFFYKPESLINITKIESPSCWNGTCKLSFFLDKNPWLINVLLNWKKVKPSILWNKINLYLKDKFTKKWKIELINRFCMKTQPYYYDFSDQFKPFIRYVESKNNFIPSWYFKIHWEKLTSDGYHTGMKLNISFSPDVVYKKSLLYDQNTIEWDILTTAKKGQKVNINISNTNGQANWAYFVVWWDNKYMANPYIMTVIYPDGAWIGDKVEIDWINFNEYNCSKDIIYVWDKVIYPDSCDYNKLVFTVPDGVNWNTIYVEVNWIKSNTYTLNSTIWWEKIFKKFAIIPVVSTKKVDLSKSSKVSLNLKLQNPLTDIYLSKLVFKLNFDKDYLPAWNFILSVNWNNKKYSFNSESYKVIQTDLINNWKITKKWNDYFIEFDNIFIPYSSKEIPLTLSFEVFNSVDDNAIFTISLPKQTIYYQNIYDLGNFKRFELSDKNMTTIYVRNKQNICFDEDSTFKNCALVLKWEDVKTPPVQSENENNQNTPTNTKNPSNTEKTKNTQKLNQDKKTQNSSHHKLSKREKIAKKLNYKKMIILNNVIKKYIIKLKRKYWWTKTIYYVLDMYKWYKKMAANVSDDFDKKLNYVDWLIHFAKAYFSFKNAVK